jgi:hypothetical protein
MEEGYKPSPLPFTFITHAVWQPNIMHVPVNSSVRTTIAGDQFLQGAFFAGIKFCRDC